MGFVDVERLALFREKVGAATTKRAGKALKS